MEQSGDLSDKVKLRIVREEIEEFQHTIKGHERLLDAIGRL
jgi:hypothetical protein